MTMLLRIAIIFAPCWLTIVAVASPIAPGGAQLAEDDPRLVAAREAYFKSIEGDVRASGLARTLFSQLMLAHAGDPLIEAYEGSLDLLDAGRSWAVWSQHDLAQQGLAKLDNAVQAAPDDLEVRFIRAATTAHLPFFFHRKRQSEEDFAFIAPKAEDAANRGSLPAPIAAAALNYYGRILAGQKRSEQAQQAFHAAVRIAPDSLAGKEAQGELR